MCSGVFLIFQRLLGDSGNNILIGRSRGVEVLLNLIRTKTNEKDILLDAMAALRNVAAHEGTIRRRNDTTMYGVRVLDLCCSARFHWFHLCVLPSLPVPLPLLACSIANNSLVARNRGVDSVLQALSAHLHDKDLVRACLACLSVLTTNAGTGCLRVRVLRREGVREGREDISSPASPPPHFGP